MSRARESGPREAPTWLEANQRHLSKAVASVRDALQRHIQSRKQGEDAADAGIAAPSLAPFQNSADPPALDVLTANFQLSPFERDVLVLCAGIDLETRIAALCAEAAGDPQRAFPTFSLALAALPDAHWSALAPTAPLRRWRLIEIGAGSALTLSPLRIDERILNALLGISHFDERLSGVIDPLPAPGPRVPSHQQIADEIAAVWTTASSHHALPAIQLCGTEPTSKRLIAGAACARVGLQTAVAAAETLTVNPSDLETLIRLWDREALLSKCALLLECDDLDAGDAARAASVARMIERVGGVLIVSTRDRRPMKIRSMVTFDVGKPTLAEQRTVWGATLGPSWSGLDGEIVTLSTQFDLSDHVIRAAGSEALGRLASRNGDVGAEAKSEVLTQALWQACRVNARPKLDDLALRIDAAADWEQLVLPDAQRAVLRDITAHVRHRGRVYEEWGFAARGARGLGISTLFAGVSGTGKTMAAEVLARDLNLDLYRIDLSAVVSKYIGESEKNLRRVFDAAEEGGAILLFDEADALFGKRSEVKDSHDRYANLEVSYLLQRMEAYRGLAVLTTNLKNSLDTAFLRRLRFVVSFPFPDAAQRAEIWQRVFPAETPTEGLDPLKLARLTVAGGNIRTMALNAAFLAADAGEPVRMGHILRAAQSEYAKLEKTLTDAETLGWV